MQLGTLECCTVAAMIFGLKWLLSFKHFETFASKLCDGWHSIFKLQAIHVRDVESNLPLSDYKKIRRQSASVNPVKLLFAFKKVSKRKTQFIF